MQSEINLGDHPREFRRALVLWVGKVFERYGLVESVSGESLMLVPNEELENLDRFMIALDTDGDEVPGALRFSLTQQLLHDIAEHFAEVPWWYLRYLKHWVKASLDTLVTGVCGDVHMPNCVSYKVTGVLEKGRITSEFYIGIPYYFDPGCEYVPDAIEWFRGAWGSKRFRDIFCWQEYVHPMPLILLACQTPAWANFLHRADAAQVAFFLAFFSDPSQAPVPAKILSAVRDLTKHTDAMRYVDTTRKILFLLCTRGLGASNEGPCETKATDPGGAPEPLILPSLPLVNTLP